MTSGRVYPTKPRFRFKMAARVNKANSVLRPLYGPMYTGKRYSSDRLKVHLHNACLVFPSFAFFEAVCRNIREIR